MATKKISELVATNPVVTALATDQYETNQGGVSKGTTNAKIAAYIETALSKLTLNGGTIALQADGSASFLSGTVQIFAGGPDDGFIFANGFALNSTFGRWQANGNLELQNGVNGTFINVDGTGLFTNQSLGNFGGEWTINPDGSMSFASGAASVSATGVGSFSDAQLGSWSVNGGVATCDSAGFLTADGLHTVTKINSDVGFTANALDGVTGDFAILVAGISKTFHFEGGILTSVT